MAIELFKDKKGWNIRKGICKANCCCSDITDKELMSLYKKIGNLALVLPTSKAEKYMTEMAKSLLGTSKMVIKKGKYIIK